MMSDSKFYNLEKLSEEDTLMLLDLVFEWHEVPGDIPFAAWMAAELTELRDYYRRVMLEPCNDEQHCTCVPALRKQVGRLQAVAEAARPAMKRAKFSLESLLEWLEGWEVEIDDEEWPAEVENAKNVIQELAAALEAASGEG